jgi:uncharacterized membrane-anchored protein
MMMTNRPADEHRNGDLLSKVPQVTLMFWVIKILATTVGETGGDAVTMTLKLGYAVGSIIFLAFFAVTLAAQVSSKRYHRFLYWAVVVATTTVGTTMSDYLDRTRARLCKIVHHTFAASSLCFSSGIASRDKSSSRT